MFLGCFIVLSSKNDLITAFGACKYVQIRKREMVSKAYEYDEKVAVFLPLQRPKIVVFKGIDSHFVTRTYQDVPSIT